MSILFLPPQSAGSVTIADATETTSGKIRIATSAEATAGTNDVTAMTPAKVKSVVDASLVGGVTYQGTFDASAPADLSNANKGDLYIISVAGTYAGKTWAVGDHLLVNADMGGTLDSAKIDKVDNTDAVTSVAGRTGAITLSTADISGLATVASTGAYSDLSGTPTLGTASAEDIGTSAGNVVQLDGSARLPAVDGSQLTNLPAPTLELNDLTDVTFTAGASIDNYVLTYDNTSGLWGAEASAGAPSASETVAGILEIATNAEATAGTATDKALVPSNISSITTAQLNNSAGTLLESANNLSDLANATTARTNLGLGTASVENVGTLANNVVQLDGLARLPAVDGSQLTNLPASSLALDDLTDVTITSAASGEVLRYNGSAWVDAQLAYSDLSGTPTLATVATSGAYSDLSGAPTNVSSFTNDAGYISDITAENLGDLADVDLTGLADGEIIIYNATSGKWEANPPPAPQATTTSVGLIEIAEDAEATAGTATDKALVPSNISSITTAQLDNSAGTMLESANNLSDLASAATARTNLGLATVASTGAYSDLTGTPTLGTAAALDVGTLANNVVQLNGSAQLPAVDGSLLTGVTADLSGATLDDLSDVAYPSAPTDGQVLKWVNANNRWEPAAFVPSAPNVTSNSPGSTYAITTHDGIEEIYLLTPSVNCTVTIPSASTAGSGYKYYIKNLSANVLTINATIDGVSGFDLTNQYSAVGIVSDGVNWFIF